MKEFWIYTGLRILLFVASLAVVLGLWLLITGRASIFWSVILAFLVSGVGSYFLLNRPRAALAAHVQTRAERMSAKMEEMRAKEDDED